MGAALQYVPPAKRPGNCLDHGIVDVAVNGRRRDVAAIRREDQPSPTSPPNRNRHPHRDGAGVIADIRLRPHAALRASGLIAPKSTMRLVSPSVRSRMSAPSGLTSTR